MRENKDTNISREEFELFKNEIRAQIISLFKITECIKNIIDIISDEVYPSESLNKN